MAPGATPREHHGYDDADGVRLRILVTQERRAEAGEYDQTRDGAKSVVAVPYDGMPMVKLGAEFLLRKYGARRQATDQTRVRRRRASWGKPHVAYHPKQR